MLYLLHCSFTEDGEHRGYGHFDFLVGAPDAESAKERLRKRLDLARARGDLFDGRVEIYLDDVIEVARAPKRGVIGRYQTYLGRKPTSLFRSLPLSGSTSCVLVEPTDDEEDGDVSEGGVVAEPFLVFGTRDG